MESGNTIEVTDRDGWRKSFPLKKRITHIGSAPDSDIVLSASRGGGVAPRHLQLIMLGDQNVGCRLVNLASADLAVEQTQGEGPASLNLPSHGTLVAASGQRIHVGEFILDLRFATGSCTEAEPAAMLANAPGALTPSMATVTQTATAIGLRLALPEITLAPGRTIEGAVIIRNQGDQPGVQFSLAMEGLPAACVTLGPAPLLFPNAEKAVALQLHHTAGPEPKAGKHRLTVHAAAPEAYPGERATVSQVIDIQPYYAHSLYLVSMDHDG
ncbi:MAG: hypothetical protein JXB35_15025 [Anaerolineae bacterium]|nr:hypothetical protein [Anaerolineae bacterium]